MSDAPSLGAGAEFDAIRELSSVWGSIAKGLGDDAAIMDVPHGERLVASVDASIEDRHFKEAWLTPEEIGYRAVAAALSDLAAMGAAPLGVLVALELPPRWRRHLAEMARGMGTLAEQYQAPIVGGNLSAGEKLGLTITVLGSARQMMTRSSVQVGDAIFVTGRLGGPALALRAWSEGNTPAPADFARFARPTPRIREGRRLADDGIRAAIDISDGLAADLGHLAAASGVRIVMELERIPCAEGAESRLAAASGEEYELAFAAPHTWDPNPLARELGVPITRIGRAESGSSEAIATMRGEYVDLPAGHDHFSP